MIVIMSLFNGALFLKTPIEIRVLAEVDWADLAACVTLLFPIVALSISTLFEGYQWTVIAILELFVDFGC